MDNKEAKPVEQEAPGSEAVEVLPPHQFRVDGKLVTLRQSYPLRTSRDLVSLYRAMNSNDMTTLVPMATRMVESWEFEGDPGDPASYDELDTISVVWPLYRHINDFWVERVLQPGKR